MVRIWDVESGAQLLSFLGHSGGVSGGGLFRGALDAAYSPDGLRLATVGSDSLARIWDAATGEELLTLAGHTAGLHSVTYSPDGRTIATSSDNLDATIKVWDAQSGDLIYTLGPNPGRAWGLSFSPDNKLLAASGFDGFIKVWDMATGQEKTNMTGKTSTVASLIFTADGQQLITGGVDSASIWDVESGTELLNLLPQQTFGIALSQDGRTLYTTTNLGAGIRAFAVPLEDAVDLAQSRLTRALSEEECRQYLHLDSCPGASVN
jgi:WD40 repeat protein